MAKKQDGEFKLGEDWDFIGVCHDAQKAVIDLTGATVKLRIGTASGNVFDLATPSGGSITDATHGAYRFVVTRAMQVTAQGISPLLNHYEYEIQAVLQDGTYTTQNYGTLVLKPSRFWP